MPRYGGAKLTGEANLKQYRELRLDGTISRLPLREVARYFTQQPLAWSGVAQGRVHATATLGRRADDFELQTRVQITPTSEGIPVSGDVQLAYHQRGHRIEFGDSHVQLPNSQVAFSGAPHAETSGFGVDSTDLRDLSPMLTILPRRVPADFLPALSAGGTAHFDGVVRGGVQIDGEASLTHFRFRGEQWDELHSKFKADAAELDAASFDLRKRALRVTGKGSYCMERWGTFGRGPDAS